MTLNEGEIVLMIEIEKGEVEGTTTRGCRKAQAFATAEESTVAGPSPERAKIILQEDR